MDPRFWTRIYGKLRKSALALGNETIEELIALSSAGQAARQARTPARRRRARRTK